MTTTKSTQKAGNIVVTASKGSTETADPFLSHPIARAIQKFTIVLDDYESAACNTIPIVLQQHIDLYKETTSKLKAFEKNRNEQGDIEVQVQGPHQLRRLLETIRTLNRLSVSKADKVLSQSLFIGIFTVYDSFIGELFTAIFQKKPDSLSR